MPRNPLFSTYRAGENRITSSMVAVFERIDLSLVERLLGAVAGESSLALIEFANQIASGSGRVPDAGISANFRYFFEVKIIPGDVNLDQLRGHLMKLDGTFADERLFVVTPDEEEPADRLPDDDRVSWLSFADLDQAIKEALADDAEQVSERNEFLLRELRSLFEVEGLLGTEDVVVVAARAAYPEYLRTSAYVCQPNRPFRPHIRRLGFYTQKAIRPEFPSIIERQTEVQFTFENAEDLEHSGSEHGLAIANVIRKSLEAGVRADGASYQVFLLTPPDGEGTLKLSAPISNATLSRNGRPSAWTQNQRYTRVEFLERQPANTSVLDAF